jgi:hypothetical protein
MFSGCLLDVITVVTPAAVAMSAAINLVSIPPVPRLDPNVVVLTVTSLDVRERLIMKGVVVTFLTDGRYRIYHFYELGIRIFPGVRSV